MSALLKTAAFAADSAGRFSGLLGVHPCTLGAVMFRPSTARAGTT